MFARSEYVVNEEVDQLGISLSAELNELAPTEAVVVTIALATRQDAVPATPHGTDGDG